MYIMPKNSKDNLFKIQQLEVKNKLLEILKINQEKNYFTLYELDNDIETQNLILALEGDCEKYFVSSTWTYFRNKKDEIINDRPYLLLLKNILSANNVNYNTSRILVGDKDNRKQTVKYIL